MGRPSVYTPEVAAEICRRLAEGESLRSICKDEKLPAESTVRDWAVGNEQGFSAQYTQARLVQASRLADELVEISDDADADPQRSRLRVDTRKWILSKMLPKVYGDRLTLEGNEDKPLVVKVVHG